MLLENEINQLFSRFIPGQHFHGNSDAETRRQSRNEHTVPLAQILESKVAQKHEDRGTRKLAVAARIALATEVGPPPLTPRSVSR